MPSARTTRSRTPVEEQPYDRYTLSHRASQHPCESRRCNDPLMLVPASLPNPRVRGGRKRLKRGDQRRFLAL
jgi:hypothetical protein